MPKPVYAMRRLEFKAKDAIELVGYGLELGLDNEAMRVYSEKKDKTRGEYHRKYSPRDVRMVRDKLKPSLAEYLAGPHFTAHDGLPPILATHISKGGTGKTALTVNLAVALAKFGFKVLLIDGDPQASTTLLMGLDPEDANIVTLRDILRESSPRTIEDAVCPIYDHDNAVLDIIPADLTLNRFEREIMGLTSRERIFHDYVQNHKEFFRQYEFVLIDTNPGTSILNFNLMLASDLVLVPVSLDGMSIKAMTSLSADFADMQRVRSTGMRSLVVVNNYHPSMVHSRENLPLMKDAYQQSISDIKIPTYAAFSRQVRLGSTAAPLLETEPTSMPAKALMALAKEIFSTFVNHPDAVF